jgi:tetratricopeptide (TPR) repeat protein
LDATLSNIDPFSITKEEDNSSSPITTAANASVQSNTPAISVANPAPVQPAAAVAPDVSTTSPDSVATTDTTDTTNSVPTTNSAPVVDQYVQKLQTAIYLLKQREMKDAEAILVSLLNEDVPDQVQRLALLELANGAREEDDLPRAQQIYEQFLTRWPDDPHIPEVLLNQGQIFRQMGLHTLALTKFYAVMTAALTLKSDRLNYYQHLVVQAQIQIAQTHYSLGEYNEAIDYLTRLFNENNPEIDKPEVLYELVRCYSSMTNYDETIANANDYLTDYPSAPNEPEVRFYLATALKQIGRNNDSLQQVLTLLQEQNAISQGHPDAWSYWRERAGNLIANEFYREGDYTRALDVYNNLAQLDSTPQWQLPVWYQIGMTYEHLMQPEKATDIYSQIVSRENDMGTNAPPSLVSMADMAHWRINFIQWQTNAEFAEQNFSGTNAAVTVVASQSPAKHE